MALHFPKTVHRTPHLHKHRQNTLHLNPLAKTVELRFFSWNEMSNGVIIILIVLTWVIFQKRSCWPRKMHQKAVKVNIWHGKFIEWWAKSVMWSTIVNVGHTKFVASLSKVNICPRQLVKSNTRRLQGKVLRVAHESRRWPHSVRREAIKINNYQEKFVTWPEKVVTWPEKETTFVNLRGHRKSTTSVPLHKSTSAPKKSTRVWQKFSRDQP